MADRRKKLEVLYKGRASRPSYQRHRRHPKDDHEECTYSHEVSRRENGVEVVYREGVRVARTGGRRGQVSAVDRWATRTGGYRGQVDAEDRGAPRTGEYRGQVSAETRTGERRE